MPGLGGTVWRKLRLPRTFRDAVPGGETPSGESFYGTRRPGAPRLLGIGANAPPLPGGSSSRHRPPSG